MKLSLLRRLLLVCSLCVAMGAAKAQYVTIPDLQLGYSLYYGFQSYITNNEMYLDTFGTMRWQLDTTASFVQNTTALNVSGTFNGFGNNIYDLTGLEYFRKTQYLNCSYNNISSIPRFDSLTYLDCSYNYITLLTDLHLAPRLQTLYCSGNRLTILVGIPMSVTELDCSNNQITSMIPLPTGLQTLNCTYNPSLTYLPSLPPSLHSLFCSDDSLLSLPALPSGLTDLDCSDNYNLSSLPTLPAALTYLNTNYDPIVSLPALPALLKHLECKFNQLSSLPTLPPSLQYLDCGNNYSIPALSILPDSLTTLYCRFNALTSLPALPSGLRDLDCGFNNLHVLPALSDSLRHLTCTGDSLSSLPALPRYLINLDCSANQLTGGLPALPASLQTLVCGNDQLSGLPSLPAALFELNCATNNLDTLPALPASLQYLECGQNHLTALPFLPQGLLGLDCSYNPALSCLPRIYQNYLRSFYIAGTAITCLPNRFSAAHSGYYSTNPDTIPLCDAASGCEFYYNIAGNVHYDTAATCAADSTTLGTPIRNLKVQLRQNGSVIQQFYTFNSGGYSFKTPSLSAYTVDVDRTTLPMNVVCPPAGYRSESLTPLDSVKKYEHMGMQCSGVDFGVVHIEAGRFRPGLTASMDIEGGNIALLLHGVDCGAGTSGTVTTTWDNAVHYIGPAPGALTPTSVSGQTLTYNIADLDILTQSSLSIMVSIDTMAIASTYSCFTTTVTPAGTDADASNNSMTQCIRIVNSWDPNYKDVSPTVLTNGTDWLTYTIHFQNTGSDTAYLVVLRDTLSPYVDASSFQYLASSHHAVIELDHNAMAFTFPHINLVDSATNPPLSEGWIQYRVKANPRLQNGTLITNTAYIYFDRNPAVVTDTAVTLVSLTTTCSDTTISLSQAICAGDTLRFYGQILTMQGSYTDTIARAGGCDSIISLTLTVNPRSPLTYIYDTICSGDTLRFLSDIFTHTDTAIYTWQNVHGCDSTVALFVAVRPGPVVTFTWDSLFPGAHSDSILLCPMQRFAMSGGNPVGGSYTSRYVRNDTFFTNLFPFHTLDTITYTYMNSNNCVGMAKGYIKIDICEGIHDIANLNDIRLYPNPNTGTFTLTTSNSRKLDYTITNMLGDVIEQKTITADTQAIDMGYAAAGVYTLYVKGARPVRFTVVR